MSIPLPEGRTALVLIGHGAPATDCPPQWIGELMSLTWHADGEAHHAARQGHTPSGATDSLMGRAPLEHVLTGRAAELDAKIRQWPRHGENDPYKAGLERLAAVLRPMVRTELFAIGYNEFCRPSIAEAIDEVIRQGASRVLIIPSMLTPGGVHSEHDIPLALDAVRRVHPEVVLEYVWPFDLAQVAALLAAHVQARLGAGLQADEGPSP